MGIRLQLLKYKVNSIINYFHLLKTKVFLKKNIFSKKESIINYTETNKTSLMAETAENTETTINDLFYKYEKTLKKVIQLGREGKFVLSPEKFWLSATNNCNLRCIMCAGEKENIYMTFEEIKQILPDDLNDGATYGDVKNIDLTSGEPLLNPDIHHIVKHCKKLYPKAEVMICSNLTLPVKGDIKEALSLIDRIGISIDGASKETYEYIRSGANFYKVLKNINDLVKLKADNIDKLTLLFVAMTINLHEIPRLIKLAYYLGIQNVFVQQVEVRAAIKFDIAQYSLSNLPDDEIKQLVIEAHEEANRLGITLTLGELYSSSPSLSTELKSEDVDVLTDSNNTETLIKMCKWPWTVSPYMRKDKNGIYPEVVCCHMPHGGRDCSLHEKEYMRKMSIREIFNSKDYWDIRDNLINGRLAETACSGCQYYKMTTWTEEELIELASVSKNL